MEPKDLLPYNNKIVYYHFSNGSARGLVYHGECYRFFVGSGPGGDADAYLERVDPATIKSMEDLEMRPESSPARPKGIELAIRKAVVEGKKSFTFDFPITFSSFPKRV